MRPLATWAGPSQETNDRVPVRPAKTVQVFGATAAKISINLQPTSVTQTEQWARSVARLTNFMKDQRFMCEMNVKAKAPKQPNNTS